MDSDSILEQTLEFITTVRGLMQQDDQYLAPTQKTVYKLMMVLREKLLDREMRKPVLKAITGLPITSQKQLTQYTHGVLIEQIEPGGKHVEDIIRYIEAECQRHIETDTLERTENLFTKRLIS